MQDLYHHSILHRGGLRGVSGFDYSRAACVCVRQYLPNFLAVMGVAMMPHILSFYLAAKSFITILSSPTPNLYKLFGFL